MARWLETNQEIEKKSGNSDIVRRERIKAVEKITGRPLVIYATDFLDPNKVNACGGEISIDGNDKLGFCEVIDKIPGDNLDVLIHSPGGEPGAAETIIEILRSKYKSLRFFVPDQAKSAATMMCCAGDIIFMDEKSELGPIDPQILVAKPDGTRFFAPAQGITAQFDKAKQSIADHPRELPAWLPILQSYAPSLLSVCEDADKLSRDLVKRWLIRYMFSDRDNRVELAERAANYLADSQNHLSHGRRIGLDQLTELGLNVVDLRTEPELRAAIWDVYIAIRSTFMITNAYKIIENGDGEAFIRIVFVQNVQMIPQPLHPIQLPQKQKLPDQDRPKRHHH